MKPALFICPSCYRVWHGRWHVTPRKVRRYNASRIDSPHNALVYEVKTMRRVDDLWARLEPGGVGSIKCHTQPIRWGDKPAQALSRLGQDWYPLQRYAVDLYKPWAKQPSATVLAARAKLKKAK